MSNQSTLDVKKVLIELDPSHILDLDFHPWFPSSLIGISVQHPYEIAFDGSKDDSARFWTIFYLMSLVNGGLFGIVVTSGTTLTSYKILVAILGLAICVIWVLIQRRMHYWCDWWDKKLVELEPEYMLKAKMPNGLLYRKRKNYGGKPPRGISTRTGGSLMPIVFGVGWLLLLVLLAWPLVHRFCTCVQDSGNSFGWAGY